MSWTASLPIWPTPSPGSLPIWPTPSPGSLPIWPTPRPGSLPIWPTPRPGSLPMDLVPRLPFRCGLWRPRWWRRGVPVQWNWVICLVYAFVSWYSWHLESLLVGPCRCSSVSSWLLILIMCCQVHLFYMNTWLPNCSLFYTHIWSPSTVYQGQAVYLYIIFYTIVFVFELPPPIF